MAQADQTVQNATFPTVRADINNNLAALFTDSSGATAPTVTVAFQDWIDTSGTDPLWKKRNAANNAWITLGTIDGNEIAFEGTLPDQSGESGKFLTTDGTDATWLAIPPGSLVDVFTASGTWTKPANGTVAYIELWGGGGGGGRSTVAAGAGGGGAYASYFIRLSDLGATETVTVGAGGTGRTATNGSGLDGGMSSVGNFTAGGGGGGPLGSSTGDPGGGGGGWRTSASGATAGAGWPDGGTSAAGISSPGPSQLAPSAAFMGGGGGGVCGGVGGNSLYGGAGGGGRNNSTVRLGGTSIYGGDGGDGGGTGTGQVGGVRGGGGGAGSVAGGNGGRGEVRIYTW